MNKRGLCLLAAVLLIACITVGCAGGLIKPAASNPEQPESAVQQTESPATEAAPEAADADGGSYYYLAELPGYYQVPDGYHVYSKTSNYTEEMCQAQGLKKEQMDLYLSMSDSSAMILPADQKYASAEAVFTISMGDDIADAPENFSALSDEELQLIADTFGEGVELGSGNMLSGSVENSFLRRDGKVAFRSEFQLLRNGTRTYTVMMVRYMDSKTVVFTVDSSSEIRQKYLDDLAVIVFSLRTDMPEPQAAAGPGQDASSRELTEEEAAFVGVWKVTYGYNAKESQIKNADLGMVLTLNDDLTGTLDDNGQVYAFTWSYTGTNEAEYVSSEYYMNFQCVPVDDAALPAGRSPADFYFEIDTEDLQTIYLTFGDWLYLCSPS